MMELNVDAAVRPDVEVLILNPKMSSSLFSPGLRMGIKE